MRRSEKALSARGFWTPPPPSLKSKWMTEYWPQKFPASEKKMPPSPHAKADLFHVIHKVPAGDSPYVKAKQVQLIEKDPSRAISLFWAAINSGDRVDSALKDMAVVMKQLNRSDEAIEAIKSFRQLCPPESQESLDNVLIELYKRSGRLEEQVELLELKLKHIEEGIAFSGKRTKTARSQGKKIQITIEQEKSRLLGNLAWAYLQQNNYRIAEELYRKALSLEPDKNKECNLAICWMHMNRIAEAKSLLNAIRALSGDGQMDESYAKSFDRASGVLAEKESESNIKPTEEDIVLFDEKNNLCGSDRGNSNCTPFRPISCSQASPQTYFVDECKKGVCSEHYSWINGIKEDSTNNQTYASMFAVRGNSELQFTRRGSLKCFNRDQKTGIYWDSGVGISHRKLSFEQAMTRQNAGPVPTQNETRWSVTSSPSSCTGEWRVLEDTTQVKNEAVTEAISKPTTVNADWKMSSWLKEEPPRKESRSCVVNQARASETFVDRDWGTGPYERSSGKDIKMKDSLLENSAGKPSPDSLEYKCKKSWADMVEEDEQELYGGSTDFLGTKFFHNPSQESSFSLENMDKKSDFGDTAEEFNDENLDNNIILHSPPLNYTENLSQKLESVDLKGHATTRSSVSSRNPAVCRSLCFGKLQQSGSSPIPLDFEGHNYGLANERESISGNGVKKMRRNRLQVFRDITLLPLSP